MPHSHLAQSQLTDIAVFLLRVALGIMFLTHSVLLKLVIFTLPGSAQAFEAMGLPGWFAYVVFTMEAVGGTMLVLGIQARWAALALTPILAGATWAHSGNGWMFGYENGGWEYPLYLTLLAIAQVLLGDGRYALARSSALPVIGAVSSYRLRQTKGI